MIFILLDVKDTGKRNLVPGCHSNVAYSVKAVDMMKKIWTGVAILGDYVKLH